MSLDFGILAPRQSGLRSIGGTQINAYKFRFKGWPGEPPPDHRSTSKCVYYDHDLAPYAELAICRGLRAGGATQAVWAESKDRALITWQKRGLNMRDIAPPEVVRILDEIHARMGRRRFGPGVWEIVSWWANPFDIHFCEVKGPGDRLRPSQIQWLQAGVDLLGPAHFSLCEYTIVD